VNDSTANGRQDDFQLDETDREILRLLQQNGRMTNAALAEAVGLTATPVLQRIKKLEQAGVIRGYAASVDAAAVGIATIAFVHVKLARHTLATHNKFLAAVANFDEVLESHHIAGEDDFLLKVAVRDIPAYERFLLHSLTKIGDIDRVKTTFVLSTAKAASPLPI
jgi:Lrp/AsnC family leucine-responsive transcriptional regulator